MFLIIFKLQKHTLLLLIIINFISTWVYNFNNTLIFWKFFLDFVFLNYYSVFWITFWELYAFFMLVYLYLYWINKKYNSSLLLVILIVLIYYIFFKISLNSSILNIYNICIFTTLNINNLLLNTLNYYHPFILYIGIFSSIWFICNQKILLKIFYIITFTLFLGSWWALQEGNWGGWWNWDPSEFYGLLYLVNIIILLHYNIKPLEKYIIIIVYVLQLLLIFESYFILQLNFNLISHNFGNKFFFFFNNNMLWFLLVYIGVLVIGLLKTKVSLVTNIACANVLCYKYFFNAFVIGVVVWVISILFIYSYSAILIKFLNTYIQIFLLPLHVLPITSLSVIIFLVLSIFYTPSSFKLVRKKRLLVFLHLLLVYNILTNLLSNDLTFFYISNTNNYNTSYIAFNHHNLVFIDQIYQISTNLFNNNQLFFDYHNYVSVHSLFNKNNLIRFSEKWSISTLFIEFIYNYYLYIIILVSILLALFIKVKYFIS